MATMISEVYDALKEAGASEEKSRKAAETMAGIDFKAGNEPRFAKIEGDLTLLKWMCGFIIAMMIPMFFRIFTH